jgi:hypothetical protein
MSKTFLFAGTGTVNALAGGTDGTGYKSKCSGTIAN